MTGDKLGLHICLDRQELTEWASLALRNSTTRQMVAVHAVRQLMASARGTTAPPMPLLYPAERTELGEGEAIFLGANDASDLNAIAAGWNIQPQLVAVSAVRHMLKDARNGVVPMMPPLSPAGPTHPPRYETFSEDNASENNYNKALRILDLLVKITETGLTAAHRAELSALEAKETVKPKRR